MKELNDEIQEDTKIYLNITWSDIGFAILVWIKELIVLPFRWLAEQFTVSAPQDEPVEAESSLIQ